MGYGPSPWIVDYIAKNYAHPSNPRLEVHMIAMLLGILQEHVLPNAEHLLSQAEKKLDSFDDPVVKCVLQNPCYTTFADWNIHRQILRPCWRVFLLSVQHSAS
jgi:hypothetical protein